MPDNAPPRRAAERELLASFIASLATSAMGHLGEGPDSADVDLSMAKQTIDLLGRAQGKDSGKPG